MWLPDTTHHRSFGAALTLLHPAGLRDALLPLPETKHVSTSVWLVKVLLHPGHLDVEQVEFSQLDSWNLVLQIGGCPVD